jgi:glycosyltransferase involved in cell wall biosynthesis
LNKIYIEVSDLLEHLLVGKPLTGISRVILHSLSGLVREFGEDRVRLLVYDSLSREMREKPANLLATLYHNPVGKTLFAEHPLGLLLICQFWNEAAPDAGDTLFHAGNWWWRPAALRAFEKLKSETGCRACFFIHDLIPIVKPEFVAADHVKRFKSGFANVARVADLLMTSSESAHDDIRGHLGKIGVSGKALEKVLLADEFAPLPQLGFHPIHALAYSIKRRKQNLDFAEFTSNKNARPFVLMVGTIENRKNVPLVLEIWKSLATKLGSELPQLVLVGKWGQGAVEMQKFLHGSKNVNGSVSVLNHVTDVQLEQLYRTCEFTIFMSQYEGWGLPIGESLWFGKEVLVPLDFALRPDMSNLNGTAIRMSPNVIHEVSISLRARKLSPPNQGRLRSLAQFQHDISKRLLNHGLIEN